MTKIKERWNGKKQKMMVSEKVDDFISDIKKVCEKHGMSISHEDAHGSFVIEGKDSIETNMKWLETASDYTD